MLGGLERAHAHGHGLRQRVRQALQAGGQGSAAARRLVVRGVRGAAEWTMNTIEALFRLALALLAMPLAVLIAWCALKAFWIVSRFRESR